jgi:3-dehydroquinate synthetase
MDLSLLKSLPDAEWKNGLSEVLKCAFIRDDNGSFYNWLIENKAAILQKTDYAIISQLIYEAVKTKATIVSKDEMETNGLRILLNLGHTFGHSLEAASRYRLAHGEAIAIGMTLAARLSLKLDK